ncbi:glycoside hydrolase family 44-domain-containing protein [Cristinia sonorae]|uniref:Glycoside hydrolase family 44-domain-containing protein n=1 Tax=Cristinia sonorae TaxID=1940300 RepID=A0A8K0XKS7_9AGAR|nr:glycoside hydrolase family 44-domain-containing protein [Cristinia sonorae]
MFPWSTLFLLALAHLVRADQVIFSDDSLSNGWQDWSWGSTIDYAATNIKEDASSLSVVSTAYSALSLKAPATIGNFAGLRFDIAGDNPPIQFYIQSTTDNSQSPTIPLTAFSKTVNSSAFTSVLVDFSQLPPTGAPLGAGTWDRINFQALGDGATYNLDNLVLVDSIVIAPKFLSAEPIGANVIAVTGQGAIDFTTLQVKLNGKPVAVKNIQTVPTVDISSKTITYLTLSSRFSPGSLVISAGNGTSFSYTIPAATNGSINQHNSFPINDRIYGVNFPTDAAYIQHLGVTISRKGGNAETAYNPFGDFTNAGNDWYFENRAADNSDDWVGWVQGAESEAIMLLPALDWVSKDATSYSYSKSVYPDQAKFDPYNADAGNGQLADGTWVTPPDPTTAYVPWNVTAAKQFLSGLVHKPEVVTIDNEIEIASNTHQDMHPNPLGYDEILQRVLNFGGVAKEALPTVQVAAPSTCAWWYYWTSTIGDSDKAAHNGSDFLPWFLQQMAAHDKATKQRLLDFLDIHYYYAPDTSANDDAAKALRLRMSRSLWDPTYVDESWINGTAYNSQPNPDKVMLIPRMQALIQQYYPGTKLSIGEFSSGADTELTGGLLTVDMLGIFGKHKLDQATYWATPDEKGPIGLAYWLFRGYGTTFGSQSAEVSIPSFNPDLLGIYAGTNAQHNNATLVVVNKDPVNPVSLHLAGLPAGSFFLRHFGGQAGIAKFQTTIKIDSADLLVVPAHTAVFLQQLK